MHLSTVLQRDPPAGLMSLNPLLIPAGSVIFGWAELILYLPVVVKREVSQKIYSVNLKEIIVGILKKDTPGGE